MEFNPKAFDDAAAHLAGDRQQVRGVVERFGIELHPEPLLIGVEL